MPEKLPASSHLQPRVLAPPEEWLANWIAPLLARFAAIEQVYLLGDSARGPYGQKPDYSLLLYAGYDRALELLTSLARGEDDLRTSEGIIHLYIENYGATFCGIWGGALIPNELNRTWQEGHDYYLWIERGHQARPLSERLRLPLERRIGDRRALRGLASTPLAAPAEKRDALQPLFPQTSETPEATSERRRSDRRNPRELFPMLEHSSDK